ncbi:MAG: recombination mediator RecR [Planctomycetes bacterium]|nr:recombination mediator RecR [Planctomycetota bacterium]
MLTPGPIYCADAQNSAPAGGEAPRARAYPKAVDRLIAELAHLPGIGRRSAERLAFYLLKEDASIAMALAQAVTDVKETVRSCSICSNLTDAVPGCVAICSICADPRRDRATVLVVEQPKDLISFEQAGSYRGLYHVLMGRLAPLDGIGPAELTVAQLLNRITTPSSNPGGLAIREVILGTNPTVEGDGTSLYLAEQIRLASTQAPAIGKTVINITRLARGLPAGSHLEFANKAVLADAILCRQSMQ